MHAQPSPPPAAPPLAAAGLALAPVPGQRAFSARRKRARPTPDAELLALGREWRASWAQEQALDAAVDAIDDIHSSAYAAAREGFFKQERIGADLRRRIALLPATTWPGMLLKIELANWAYDIRDEDIADKLKHDTGACGTALLFSLSRDLRAWFGPPRIDAELLKLNEQFEQAWAAQSSMIAMYDALPNGDWPEIEKQEEIAAARVKRIVEKIEALPATTLEGLAVKMRACFWCHGGEPFDRDSFGEATDLRLVGSILCDIQKLDGRPQPDAAAIPQIEEHCHA